MIKEKSSKSPGIPKLDLPTLSHVDNVIPSVVGSMGPQLVSSPPLVLICFLQEDLLEILLDMNLFLENLVGY